MNINFGPQWAERPLNYRTDKKKKIIKWRNRQSAIGVSQKQQTKFVRTKQFGSIWAATEIVCLEQAFNYWKYFVHYLLIKSIIMSINYKNQFIQKKIHLGPIKNFFTDLKRISSVWHQNHQNTKGKILTEAPNN